jgi:hypothetical protein
VAQRSGPVANQAISRVRTDPASHVPVGNEAPKQPLLSLMSLPLPRSTSMEIAEPLCSSLQSLLVLAWTELRTELRDKDVNGYNTH